MSTTPTTRVTYDDDDIHELLDLVEKHQKDLLNKERDTGATTARRHAWISVADSYNDTRAEKDRKTDKMLTKKWENLVFSTKTAESQVKQGRRMTGGGEGGPDLSVIERRVSGILKGLHQPFPNDFDGDAGHHTGMESRFGGGDKNTVALCEDTAASSSQFMMSKTTRKRQHQQQTMSRVGEEVTNMRREEHEMKKQLHEREMYVLHLQEEYWIERRRRLSSNTVLPESPEPSPFPAITDGHDTPSFFGPNFTPL